MRRPAPPHVLRLLHRGRIRASALLIDGGVIGEGAARRRVLSHWTPGTHVHRQGRDWIVRWPSPRALRCEQAAGVPLVEQGGALVGAPIPTDSLRAGTTVRMVAGTLRVEPFDAAHTEDVSAWIDVDDFTVAAVRPLGAPLSAPRVVDLPPVEFDARASLDGIPPASAEQQRLIRALLAKGSGDTRSAPAAAAAGRSLLAAIAAPLLGALGRLRAWMQKPGAARTGAGDAGARRHGAGMPAGESWLARWLERLISIVQRTVWSSYLGRILGRRHAEHLHRMMEMFERGDTLEALRHAIPLGGEVAASLRSLNLGAWAPRRDLSIRPHGTPASMALGLGADLFSQLQAVYRNAFRRLEAQGRIDEAAFVLAELLHADAEAVAFLEKHGRLRLAAEMAEARELPAGLVVRQWFLAGDRARAVEIAARRGAFADAAIRLERSGKADEAVALRLLWGHRLAQAGDYAAAVEVVWPHRVAWPLAVEWIDRAVESGAPSGLALLPRKLEARPEAFPEVRDRAIALFEAEDAAGVTPRTALALALATPKPIEGLDVLARAAARAMLRDAALHGSDWPAARLNELVAASGDGALRTDMPSHAPRSPAMLSSVLAPVTIAIAGSRIGTAPILDAAYLPGGRTVVARGEAGAFLLSPRGKTIAHFDVPAHRLVVSDFGDRAIAVAPRGRGHHLSRLDFFHRTCAYWHDVELTAFAPDYDGRHWFVATSDLLAIDTQRPGFEGSWGVSDVVPADASAQIARTTQRLFVHVAAAALEQVWCYQLPQLVLRERRNTDSHLRPGVTALGREGRLVEHHTGNASDERASLRCERADGTVVERVLVEHDGETCGRLATDADWIAATVMGDGYARVSLLDAHDLVPRASVRLERSTTVSLRFGAGALTIADDLGRLLVLDLRHGWRLQDLCL